MVSAAPSLSWLPGLPWLIRLMVFGFCFFGLAFWALDFVVLLGLSFWVFDYSWPSVASLDFIGFASWLLGFCGISST